MPVCQPCSEPYVGTLCEKGLLQAKRTPSKKYEPTYMTGYSSQAGCVLSRCSQTYLGVTQPHQQQSCSQVQDVERQDNAPSCQRLHHCKGLHWYLQVVRWKRNRHTAAAVINWKLHWQLGPTVEETTTDQRSIESISSSLCRLWCW